MLGQEESAGISNFYSSAGAARGKEAHRMVIKMVLHGFSAVAV